MNRRLRLCTPVLCASLILVLSATAQPPAQPAPGGAAGQTVRPGGRAPYVPKNLKVLPDNTDLRRVMHEYEQDLGVECEYCHVGRDPVTHREGDRASDANPMKDVARTMIRMTDDLNEKYLTQLPNNVPNVDANAKVNCGTCHRGHAKPEAFVPPPRQEGNRPPGGGQGPMPAPPAASAPGSGPAS